MTGTSVIGWATIGEMVMGYQENYQQNEISLSCSVSSVSVLCPIADSISLGGT